MPHILSNFRKPSKTRDLTLSGIMIISWWSCGISWDIQSCHSPTRSSLTALGSLGAGIVFFAFSSCNSCTGEPGSDRGYASGVGQGAAARAGLAAAAMDRKPKAEVRSKAATNQPEMSWLLGSIEKTWEKWETFGVCIYIYYNYHMYYIHSNIYSYLLISI